MRLNYPDWDCSLHALTASWTEPKWALMFNSYMFSTVTIALVEEDDESDFCHTNIIVGF